MQSLSTNPTPQGDLHVTPPNFTTSSAASASARPAVQRDTRAWQWQVWVSFASAGALCAIGLAWLPGTELEQVFMVMGYVFCLSAVFGLSKFVRDNAAAPAAPPAPAGAGDTPLWKLVVWGGFAVAMGLTGWGLLGVDISATYKAFLGVSWLYLITTAFTLAKMLRDRHEADLADADMAERLPVRRAQAPQPKEPKDAADRAAG